MAFRRLRTSIFVFVCMACDLAADPKFDDANFNFVTEEPLRTFPNPFQPAFVRNSYDFLENDCPGCRSKDRMADSETWEPFNASGKALKKQALHLAQAMGWNGEFEEFVPVRYAEQAVSGQRFFVRVRVDPHGVFIDMLVFIGFSSSNEEPTVEGIRVGKDEEDPIDEFKASPSLQTDKDCAGCRSKEWMADSDIWELFNASGKALKKQAEHLAQAMGWNGEFEEFVPVRYAEQSVSGQRFFVRVRVDPHGVFIDTLIFIGFSSSNEEPTVEGIRVGKDEEDPIDDFESLEIMHAVEVFV